jgi:hypothetical protein
VTLSTVLAQLFWILVTSLRVSINSRVKRAAVGGAVGYQRQDDGKWTVLYRNKVVLGSNVDKDIIPGDDPQALQLTARSHLHRILNAT